MLLVTYSINLSIGSAHASISNMVINDLDGIPGLISSAFWYKLVWAMVMVYLLPCAPLYVTKLTYALVWSLALTISFCFLVFPSWYFTS